MEIGPKAKYIIVTSVNKLDSKLYFFSWAILYRPKGEIVKKGLYTSSL